MFKTHTGKGTLRKKSVLLDVSKKFLESSCLLAMIKNILECCYVKAKGYNLFLMRLHMKTRAPMQRESY